MVIIMTKANFLNFIKIKSLDYNKDHPYLLAIDGPCASGKTTFAKQLCKQLKASLLQLDDYYLPPNKTSLDPIYGGNIDYLRFRKDILYPLSHNQKGVRQRYDCHTHSFTSARLLEENAIYIIEGSYSLHPYLRAFYHTKIFLTIPRHVQDLRLQKRESANSYSHFLARWIPLENAYFDHYKISKESDFIITPQMKITP